MSECVCMCGGVDLSGSNMHVSVCVSVCSVRKNVRVCMCVDVDVHVYRVAGYFRGVYISQISHFFEVTMLGTWVWFSINFANI